VREREGGVKKRERDKEGKVDKEGWIERYIWGEDYTINEGKEKRYKRKMAPEIAKIEKRDRQKDINNIGSGREGDIEGRERGRGDREGEGEGRERERESKETEDLTIENIMRRKGGLSREA
jgi:hypothetical protein